MADDKIDHAAPAFVSTQGISQTVSKEDVKDLWGKLRDFSDDLIFRKKVQHCFEKQCKNFIDRPNIEWPNFTISSDCRVV